MTKIPSFISSPLGQRMSLVNDNDLMSFGVRYLLLIHINPLPWVSIQDAGSAWTADPFLRLEPSNWNLASTTVFHMQSTKLIAETRHEQPVGST
jgi:hypothetical protein